MVLEECGHERLDGARVSQLTERPRGHLANVGVVIGECRCERLDGTRVSQRSERQCSPLAKQVAVVVEQCHD